MKVKSIKLDRLIEELDSSINEIGDVIRRRKLTISLRAGVVSREDANSIARFLKSSIDWRKIERDARAEEYQVPWVQGGTDRNQIQEWFKKILTNSKPLNLDRDCLLGAVFTGGFLGESESEFALALDPGVNILIGERGTGKSTALKLLSLLSDSISEETEFLVKKLTRLIKTREHPTDITSRIRHTMQQYEIDKYACFCVTSGKVFCYYVNIDNAAHDILTREDGNWISIPFKEIIRPRMQVLQQGEVTRIGDERSYDYLNNILDAIYPSLNACRNALATRIGAFGLQSDNYKKTEVQVNAQKVDAFILDRQWELRRINDDIQRGALSDESVQLIRGYLNRIYQVDRHRLPNTIAELLRGDEDAFYQLFLGRVVPFLRELTNRIEHLKERESQFLAKAFDGNFEESEDAPGFLNSRDMFELDADKEALAEIEKSSSLGDTDDLSPLTRLLFQRAIEREFENPIKRKQLQVGRDVLDLLYVRLRVLRTWLGIFSRPRLEWTHTLSALVKSAVELLQLRIDLLKEQESTCRAITNALTSEDLDIKIFTIEQGDTLLRHQIDVEALQNLGRVYDRLFTALPTGSLKDLRNTAMACDDYLERFESLLETTMEVLDSNTQHPFVFVPIDVHLRHGGALRNFGQLSFGQKSGIILDMVLLTSEDGIVIIDQPEDNLDASAIATLIPTLNNLANKRQVIIATHNSSLVLGLNADNVVVLEATGVGGRVKISGAPHAVVEDMLEILEGGRETFERKMLAYEEFINRLSASIDDIDLKLIESSFRQRMLDGLRNILQPIIDDKSRLQILKHELQNILDPFTRDSRNADNAGASQRTTEDVLNDIDVLSKQLDINIKRMQTAINDINLMDTKPDFQKVDLYSILKDIAADYLEGIGKSRRIKINLDESLSNHFAYADAAHLRLVFRNLFNNSFRSTEQKHDQVRKLDPDFTETVKVQLTQSDKDDRLALLFMDNGKGILPHIRKRLYVERCSDRDESLHGMGGVIIRKILDLNNGTIQVLPATDQFAMVQKITLTGAETAMAVHIP